MQLTLTCYQHKMDCNIYKIFYVSLIATTKQKPTVDTQKIKRKSKHTTMNNHQFRKENNERKKRIGS